MKLVSHEKNTEESSNEYETPALLYKKLHKVFKFDLDVAAQKETAKCARWLGPGSKLAEDALKVSWTYFGKSCWCNPPYDLWGEFAKHATYYRRPTRTVMIVPPRTDTRSFHKYMSKASQLVFLQGRVSFLLNGVPMTRNGAPSMIAVFGPQRTETPVVKFWDWKHDPYPS